MKIHLGLTCLAYAYFGFGFAVQQWGIKAGLGLNWTLGIFLSSMIFFMIVIFTSLEKVKKALGFFKDKPNDDEIEWHNQV